MNTSGRRRKQAVGGYRNLRPQQRPHYSIVSREKSQRKLQDMLTKQKLMQTRKK